MSITDLTRVCAITLSLGLGTAAVAQETPAAPAAEAPAAETAPAAEAPADLNMGQTEGQPAADGPGSTYVAATHGAWEQRCIRSEDGSDPCQLYQLLKDKDGNSVAEISLFALPAGQQAAAGATIIAPLETLLTAQLSLKVDSAAAKVYPFTWCSQVGCVSRVGFTQAEVDGFKKGNKATITIVPVVAPDEKVLLDVSLSGFTAGYDAVAAANAKN
ncbi:invasion associated locus B family protein [Cereibacter changlensis JA139]|uniref:Invasion associated locus B family protein n=2 Tax=Cereibacter changlensis TaxID=402884 RepID=A0A2T4JXB7_9RHOB|nr:invasion associated locus B family protein [Cereibacter changlensis]PTE22393.1 invasion associated locus B family protein [Cereibacter changlensis JA139]PZX57406.1 invasion protein IalB [Cereibacter changlensis]